MKPQIIVMLTHNDVTVTNARECFQQAADLPVKYWGFKDVGLSTKEMKGLVADFLEAGKTPVLEVVNFEGPGLLRAAALAVECGVQYFTGGLFSRSVLQLMRQAGTRYFPFCGDVGGSPVQMRGTPEAVLADAERLVGFGVDGVDLVAYRFTGGAPIALATEVQERLGGERLIVAGSINSRERMTLMQDVNPFAYTMGGALFDGAFAPGKSFRDNLERVVTMDAAIMGNSA